MARGVDTCKAAAEDENLLWVPAHSLIEIGARLRLSRRYLALVIGYYLRSIIARGSGRRRSIPSRPNQVELYQAPLGRVIGGSEHRSTEACQRDDKADEPSTDHVTFADGECSVRRLNSTTSCRRI